MAVTKIIVKLLLMGAALELLESCICLRSVKCTTAESLRWELSEDRTISYSIDSSFLKIEVVPCFIITALAFRRRSHPGDHIQEMMLLQHQKMLGAPAGFKLSLLSNSALQRLNGNLNKQICARLLQHQD